MNNNLYNHYNYSWCAMMDKNIGLSETVYRNLLEVKHDLEKKENCNISFDKTVACLIILYKASLNTTSRERSGNGCGDERETSRGIGGEDTSPNISL